MKKRVYLELPLEVYLRVRAHLLSDPMNESSAFLFVQPRGRLGVISFSYIGEYLVPDSGYCFRSGYHLDLAEHVQAEVIKRAHDLQASLVELHSHIGHWPAKFSESDFSGFGEFVPHVWWRLKGAPYLAVVMTNSGFDGLAWVDKPESPQPLDGLRINGRIVKPTGLSFGVNLYG